MQEKDLEKFIVFVESMRNGNNDDEVDVIMEGFFNVYGGKNQFNYNDKESAMKLAMTNPGMMKQVWPKLYASNPEILMAALQHPDAKKAKGAYEFIRKFMQPNPAHKGTLGEVMEKGVQTALKNPKLKDVMQSFLTKRMRPEEAPRMSRTQDKALEREWAAGRDEKADEILTRSGL